jgi:hypothetical protein
MVCSGAGRVRSFLWRDGKRGRSVASRQRAGATYGEEGGEGADGGGVDEAGGEGEPPDGVGAVEVEEFDAIFEGEDAEVWSGVGGVAEDEGERVIGWFGGVIGEVDVTFFTSQRWMSPFPIRCGG